MLSIVQVLNCSTKAMATKANQTPWNLVKKC